ncbi:hypothetical protein YC2023_071955 [Brassica napus]
MCPSAHTGRPWLSIITHISTLYTQDVRGFPPAHTGRSWLFVAVRQHTQDVLGYPCVSMCFQQHTQDVRGCPSVHIAARWSLDSARWPFPWTVWVILAHVGCLFSTHRTSVGIRQHTQDICGCLWLPVRHTGRLWLSVCVRVCPSAHTGRPWLSISTHISTLVFGVSTLAFPVDCSCDFGPRGLSFQYTQDVHGCPSEHTRRLCVSVSTHRTSLAVRVCPSAHTGCPWLSISTHISTLVLGLSTLTLPVDCQFSTHRTSVCVRQHTQDVRVCLSAHTRRLWLSVSTHRTSVAVRVCPSAHTRRLWLSISTHISTLFHGLSTLALPLDCLGDFGPCGLFVQYTQDVRGCPPAHTSRPLLSVCVHVCPSAHTGRPWLSISTHISTLVLGLSTLALLVDCLGDFGPRGLSVQYIQDVNGYPPAHTGHLWLSVAVCQHTQDVCGYPCVFVCVLQRTQDVRGCPSVHISAPWTSLAGRVCPCVSVSTHRTSVAVDQYTYQHVGPWTQHADPSRGLSVQYTQDIRVCSSAHTGRPCVSVSTHKTSVAVRQHTQNVRGCPCVSVSTHKTSVAVHQYTYQHVVPWTQHAGPSLGLFGRFWPMWAVCSVHTGRPWVSTSTHKTAILVRVCPCVSVSTHMTSLAIHQYTYQHAGPWTQHAGPSSGLFGTSVAVRVCPCVSVSAHRTSVAVHQYTYQHVGPWTQLAGPSRGLFGRFWPRWDVCSVHTGHPWVSASTHRTSVAVCGCPSGHTGCPWLSVCVCVCPSAHTGRPWLSVQYTQDVRGCPTSVAVHQYTYQHVGPWTQHADPSRGLFGTSVAVCGCPSPHTGRPWLSMCVRVCPSAHTGRLWLSISTHISTLVLGLSTLALPVDCSRDIGRQGLSFQYTQDVSGCPSEHTGRLCVSVSTHRTSVAVHQYTYQHVGPWTQHADPFRGLLGTAVAVLVCPSAHTGRPWLSISTHISTLVLGLSTLALPVDCSGDFGPCGLSVQYTQDVRVCPSAHKDVRVCPSAHTRRLWLSVSIHRTFVAVRQRTQDVRGCPSVHISARWPFLWTVWVILAYVGCLFSTHRTSVGVRQHTHDVCGCPWLSVSTHRTSVAIRVSPCVSVCVRQHTQDVRGCLSVHISARCTHRTPVGVRQNTLDVCVCPSTHTGRLWLSVCVCVGPSAHTGRPWLSISTHIRTLVLGLSTLTLPVDSRCCPCVSVSTHRTSMAVHQYTYQHAVHTGRPCVSVSTQGRPCVSVSTHKTSVAVRQHTQDIRSYPSPHTARLWLSISTHIRTFVIGVSTLALPVDCLGFFSGRGLSVQYTQDFRGCPPAHPGRLWLSVSTHRMSVAIRVCPCVSISTHRMSMAVNQYTYQHAGPWTQHAGPWTQHAGPWTQHAGPWTQHAGPWTQHAGPWTQHAGPSRGLFGTHGTSVAVRVCPCVSVSTHRTSVAVHQYTYQHVGPWTQHADASRGLLYTGRLCVSVSTHRTSVCVRQHTQDVCGCPLAHTWRPWLSVCVHVFLSAHTGRSWLSGTLSLPVDCSGDFGPRGLSRQHTQDIRVCPSEHTGRPWLSVCVHVCPSAHIGRPWLSISTHISTLVLGLSTLALPVDCLGDFGPRGLSVQYTQDVHGCPPAHTGRQWLSVAVRQNTQDISGCPCVSVCVRQHTQDARVCPSAHTGCTCVSVSTHRMFVAVHPYTYQHAGPWTQHAGPSSGLFGPQSTDQYMEPNQPGDQNVLNISTEVHVFHRTGQTDRAVYWTVMHMSGKELWLEPWPDDRSDHTGACLSRPTSHLKTYGRARIHFGRAGRGDTYLGELDELSELSDTTLELDELSELNDTSLELNELSNTEDGAGSAAGRNGPFQPKEKFIKSSLWDCFFPKSTSPFLSPFQAHSHQEYQEGVIKEVLVMHGKKNSTKIINFGL